MLKYELPERRFQNSQTQADHFTSLQCLSKCLETSILEKESLNHVRRRGRLGLYKPRLGRRIDKYIEQFVENVIKTVNNKTAGVGDFTFFAGDEVILPVVEGKISKLKNFDYEFLKLDIKTPDAEVLSKSLEVFRKIKRGEKSRDLERFFESSGFGS